MNRTPVKSSQIKAIGHNPKTNTLEVEFPDGSLYSYANFTKEHHEAFMASPSLGSHFIKTIKAGVEKWPFTKIKGKAPKA